MILSEVDNDYLWNVSRIGAQTDRVVAVYEHNADILNTGDKVKWMEWFSHVIEKTERSLNRSDLGW